MSWYRKKIDLTYSPSFLKTYQYYNIEDLIGTAKLVGTSKESIFNNAKALLTNKKLYQKMAQAKNPYGNGKTSQRIVRIISEI